MAFSSSATNLALDDANGVADVFVHDRQTGSTILVSRSTAGAPGNAPSQWPVISGDGSTVLFVSSATNLVPGAPVPSAYAHDLTTGVTSLVPLPSGVIVATYAPILGRKILSASQDGRYAAVGGRTRGQSFPIEGREVFVVDRDTGATVSRVYGNRGSLSGDGRYLAYESAYLNGAIGPSVVRLLDRQTSTVANIPMPTGSQAEECGYPVISSTSAWVAFECLRQPPVGGYAEGTKVYLFDRQAGSTTQIAVPDGMVAYGRAFVGDISAEGRYVVFNSFNQVTGNAVGGNQVFRYDRQTRTWTLISISSTGRGQTAPSFGPAMSADGQVVAFASAATHFTAGDTNTFDDVFVADPACSFSVIPTSVTLPGHGGAVTINVSTASRCSWVAESPQPWAVLSTPAGPPGGTGSGPLTITAASNPTSAARIVQINVAGQLVTLSQPAASEPQVPPGPPAQLTSTVAGNMVTLQWIAPASGSAPTGYIVEAGSASGSSNLAVVPTGNTNTSFSASAPNGTYHVRVKATSSYGIGGPSNEVVVRVGCVAPPLAPSGLSQSVTGSQVFLSWSSSAGATGYVVNAGSSPGLSNLAALSLSGQSLTAQAPPGVYYVRTHARNACGVSPPSNEVTVVVGVTPPPAAPTGLGVVVTGSHARFVWSAPSTGTPATGYVLEAGTGPGLTNIARLMLGPALVHEVIGVPTGTYYVRVRATGGAGVGPPSNEVVVSVP